MHVFDLMNRIQLISCKIVLNLLNILFIAYYTVGAVPVCGWMSAAKLRVTLISGRTWIAAARISNVVHSRPVLFK